MSDEAKRRRIKEIVKRRLGEAEAPDPRPKVLENVKRSQARSMAKVQQSLERSWIEQTARLRLRSRPGSGWSNMDRWERDRQVKIETDSIIRERKIEALAAERQQVPGLRRRARSLSHGVRKSSLTGMVHSRYTIYALGDGQPVTTNLDMTSVGTWLDAAERERARKSDTETS
jgi:hypothetical protein